MATVFYEEALRQRLAREAYEEEREREERRRLREWREQYEIDRCNQESWDAYHRYCDNN